MSILQRFFAKGGAGTPRKESRALQLLFATSLNLDPDAVSRSLRAYHPSMANATFEVDTVTAAKGTPLGLIEWGDHVIRFVGFDRKMPSEFVERCLEPAHFAEDLKVQARAHQAHLLIDYAGAASDPLTQYVALAAVAGVFAAHGAIVVLNEAAHSAVPSTILAKSDGDMLTLLESLPIPLLYSGFVKFDIEGVQGTWMRTFGNHLLGVPDLALLAKGHHEGQAIFDMFSTLISYLRSSGATFAPGHTTQVGTDTFLKVRGAEEGEYFLENPGPLLVLERIPKSAINQGRR